MKFRRPTHPFICGKTHAGKFQVKRKSRRDRMLAKLRMARGVILDRQHAAELTRAFGPHPLVEQRRAPCEAARREEAKKRKPTVVNKRKGTALIPHTGGRPEFTPTPKQGSASLKQEDIARLITSPHTGKGISPVPTPKQREHVVWRRWPGSASLKQEDIARLITSPHTGKGISPAGIAVAHRIGESSRCRGQPVDTIARCFVLTAGARSQSDDLRAPCGSP